MKIYVHAWMRDSLEKQYGYDESQPMDGDVAKAFEVARDLFEKGLNVLVRRFLWEGEETVGIFIDTKAFTRR